MDFALRGMLYVISRVLGLGRGSRFVLLEGLRLMCVWFFISLRSNQKETNKFLGHDSLLFISRLLVMSDREASR